MNSMETAAERMSTVGGELRPLEVVSAQKPMSCVATAITHCAEGLRLTAGRRERHG
ncbi:hypothetical protein [Kutzneria buriramensis]|uniref:Uncharacterized protein n=1 Tax=Kutzneria buriramensis TaxID=1045776 RepID=A0A3E0GWU4_9PSEU|nr:hypothetical protein [Kutzneria buriramensis]REH28585.1 hypothetical protein BCF44_12627 [Kutzneria buriramensis]